MSLPALIQPSSLPTPRLSVTDACQMLHEHYGLQAELTPMGSQLSTAQQLTLNPDNPYLLANAAHEWEVFDVARAVPPELMGSAIIIKHRPVSSVAGAAT